MSDWTAGYVSEIEYTHGYYSELNPLRAAFALTLAGYAAPAFETACELGYGQGVSLNLHAAASGLRWWGTDFNPAQADNAQRLAQAGATGRAIADEQGFEQYCTRSDLPMFDFIGLHGIWSWISDSNRKAILTLIRNRLKVGGVVYLSYNTQPGWAAFAPMRALLKLHADTLSAPGTGVVRKVDEALAFAERLLAVDPLYAKANPTVQARTDKLKTMSRHYLAHEYFNSDWLPMRFDECAALLETAKLSFACSAATLDHVEALNLKPAQQKLLAEISDPSFRQTTRDYCVNQQFRRDYWVKGPRRLNAMEHLTALRALRVVMVLPLERFKYTVTGALGEATLQEPAYRPVVELLADHKPRTLGELEQAFAGGKGPGLQQLAQVAAVLVGKGVLQVAQTDAAMSAARKTTDAINRHLLQRARSSDTTSYLASPLTAGGVLVARVMQLFILARQQGAKQPQDYAAFVWQVLSAMNQRMLKDGKALETPEQNLAKLVTDATDFLSKEWPVLHALGVA